MSEQDTFHPPRFRLNASQTAKGVWKMDCTVENAKESWQVPDPDDISVVTVITLGQKVLDMLKDAEQRFRKDGRKLAGDSNE